MERKANAVFAGLQAEPGRANEASAPYMGNIVHTGIGVVTGKTRPQTEKADVPSYGAGWTTNTFEVATADFPSEVM
jgi:hypothetical protein